ncbi:MAG TPA: class I SAM-dependent methyltransferase [Patescibacteria group bacterium]|nr:class I SAM-dependent methyltransferase [Patescibacteria group bacterium]
MKNDLFYDSVVEDKRETGGYYNEKIEFLIKETGEHKTVLDVGCNDGFISKKLLANSNIVYGVDIVKNNLLKAKEAGIKAYYHDIESGRMPFKENMFDVVILGDIIEHVFDTDALLKESYRLLKKRGKLIVTTPNVASIGRRLMLLFGVSPYLEYSPHLTTNGLPSVGHIRYYTQSTLESQLKVNKFLSIHTIGDKFNIGLIRSRILGVMLPSVSVNLMCVGYK